MTVAAKKPTERGWRYLDEIGWRVLGDKVIVEPDEEPDVVRREEGGLGTITERKSGLIVNTEEANARNERAVIGTIVGLGPGRMYDSPMGAYLVPVKDREGRELQLGDRVFHSMYGFTEMDVGGVGLYAMPGDRILMVLVVE